MIKTFPLRLTLDEHKKIKDAAYLKRESIHEYIKKSVELRIIKEGE